MLTIGPHPLDRPLIAAPMAGVTDRVFRQMVKRLGAGAAVAEMVTSDAGLWHTPKSRFRLDYAGEPGPIWVQIAGADPGMLADAARQCVARGAEIIDINMGCPAKKVCRRAAGSALLADEPLVEEILHRVVDAVDVPVTLKMRTGIDPSHRNALRVAELAEHAGISALSIHGRTRAEKYGGKAEYDTISEVKRAVDVPVIANGDVVDGPSAARVLEQTGADGLMIGRAAQGDPWIFARIAAYLERREFHEPSPDQQHKVLAAHLESLWQFYGAERGLKIARKHIVWYLSRQPGAHAHRKAFLAAETTGSQMACLNALFASGEELARAA